MTDQENQTPLSAQEASEAIAVQPDQQDKNALTLQEVKRALLDELNAQKKAIEELSDEQLAAIGGGVGEFRLGRSMSLPLERPAPDHPLRRANSVSEHELQILRQQAHTPHLVTPPASPGSGSGPSSPVGPLEMNKRRRLG